MHAIVKMEQPLDPVINPKEMKTAWPRRIHVKYFVLFEQLGFI